MHNYMQLVYSEMNSKYIMLLLILFIVIMSTYNTYTSSLQEKEPFTPYIRKFYRPYIRNARVTIEDFVEHISTYLKNMLRKVGLM